MLFLGGLLLGFLITAPVASGHEPCTAENPFEEPAPPEEILPEINLHEFNILINEIEYDTDWIEIICLECQEGFPLQELKLLKNSSSSTYFRFPEGSLHTGDYLLLQLRQETDLVEENTIYSKKSGLASQGSLHLVHTESDHIFDSISWEKKPNTEYVSFARGEDDMRWTATATPGKENTLSDPAPPPEEIVEELPEPKPEEKEELPPEETEEVIGPFEPLLISEVLVNPQGSDKGQEFITVFNPYEHAISLQDWVLDNKEGGSKPYVVSDISIAAQESHRFSQDETGISLTNTVDEARLFSPDGVLQDTFSWKNAPEGKIYTRDGEGLFDEVIVSEIVDGDTVKVIFKYGKKKDVRLLGVDSPETVHPDKEVEFFGPEAKEFLESQLLDKTVILRYDEQLEDDYDRLLAYIFLEDSTLFNAEVIRQGFGAMFRGFPFVYWNLFAEFEAEAQREKRGIWGDPPSIEEAPPESEETSASTDYNYVNIVEAEELELVELEGTVSTLNTVEETMELGEIKASFAELKLPEWWMLTYFPLGTPVRVKGYWGAELFQIVEIELAEAESAPEKETEKVVETAKNEFSLIGIWEAVWFAGTMCVGAGWFGLKKWY